MPEIEIPQIPVYDRVSSLLDDIHREEIDLRKREIELREREIHAKRIRAESNRKLHIWTEIKKHRGWYFVAVLLSALPVGFATIWPTLTHETVPEWLAQHGWPRLPTLLIAWIAVVAIIALVIVARSAQTALRAQRKGDES